MHVQRFNSSPYDANGYLVNGKILIDPGMSSRALIKEMEKYIDLKDIELIVLTHCHYDHSGAAVEISRRSGAPIGIHREDAQSLKDDKASVAMLFGNRAPNIEPDIIYEEGDSIPIGEDESLEIIHTPGHTPGCICLYEPVSKGLFSGDTVFPGGGIGRTDFVGGSAQNLTTSIEKLTKLDVKTLYPGHGAVTDTNVNEQIHLSLQMSRTIH